MSATQMALVWGVNLALVATLVGLARRRRLRLCWTFPLYALAVVCCETLVAVWPSRFYTPAFWLLKQALYDATKVGVALELAYRVMRMFPGALRTARKWVLLLLWASTLLIVMPPWSASYRVVGEWQPRILLGVVWLFALTALIVLWYRLPVAWWHRALLMGFAPYLLLFTVVLTRLRAAGWDARVLLSLLDGTAYLALTLWWAVAAWAPEPGPEAVPASLRQLGLEQM